MSATVTRIHAEVPTPLHARAGLPPEAERAAAFLLTLDDQMDGADVPRLAWLLGCADAHIANLLDLVGGAR